MQVNGWDMAFPCPLSSLLLGVGILGHPWLSVITLYFLSLLGFLYGMFDMLEKGTRDFFSLGLKVKGDRGDMF